MRIIAKCVISKYEKSHKDIHYETVLEEVELNYELKEIKQEMRLCDPKKTQSNHSGK